MSKMLAWFSYFCIQLKMGLGDEILSLLFYYYRYCRLLSLLIAEALFICHRFSHCRLELQFWISSLSNTCISDKNIVLKSWSRFSIVSDAFLEQLTHLIKTFSFPWKRQKTIRFSNVFRMHREQWLKRCISTRRGKPQV